MKRISILLSAVLLMLFMAACQNNAAPAPSPTPAPTPAAQEAVDADEDEDEDEDIAEEQERAELPENATPFEMYTFAMEAIAAEIAEVNSFKLGTVMHILIDSDDETVEMEMDMIISQVTDGSDTQMKIDAMTSVMGMDMEMTIFFKDGVAYMDMMGMQMQMPMSLDELLAEFDVSMDDFEAVDFELEDIISQEARVLANGVELEFVLDPDTMNDAMEEAMEMLEMMGLEGDDVTIEFKDVLLIAVLNADYHLEYTRMFSSFLIEAEGEVIFMEMDMIMEFIQFGGVTIDFPENLDEFIEF